MLVQNTLNLENSKVMDALQNELIARRTQSQLSGKHVLKQELETGVISLQDLSREHEGLDEDKAVDKYWKNTTMVKRIQAASNSHKKQQSETMRLESEAYPSFKNSVSYMEKKEDPVFDVATYKRKSPEIKMSIDRVMQKKKENPSELHLI